MQPAAHLKHPAKWLVLNAPAIIPYPEVSQD